MSALRIVARNWWFRRFHPTVRFGWMAARSGVRGEDPARLWFGLALIGFGLVRGRSRRRLVYKTSIDVDQGTAIRVRRGRVPIAQTTPIT